MRNDLVLVRGGGRLGTAVAHRLRLCGFPVIMTEAARPTLLHRRACFGSVIYETDIMVEDVPARRCSNFESLSQILEAGVIPVLVDPAALVRESATPWVLVDAIGLERNVGTRITDAPIVIGVGPGFAAGMDVHAVVESRDGNGLGTFTVTGKLDDPVPGPWSPDLDGIVLSGGVGRFESLTEPGRFVGEGDEIGRVGGQPVTAPRTGLVTGILMDGLFVGQGVRLADVDARTDPRIVTSLDPRARAVAGGVLEAILYVAAIGKSEGQGLSRS